MHVTQRQTSTNYSVAACVSRVADAQWLRTCEGVRRFSPVVGQLGEWRALCEGGWTGPIPKDLPNDSDQETRPPNQDDPNSTQTAEDIESPTLPTTLETRIVEQKPSDRRLPPTSVSSDEFGVSRPKQPRNKQFNDSPSVGGLSQSSSSSGPNSTLDHLKPSSEIRDNFGTLSVFPSPPSHFPIPPMSGSADLQWQGHPQPPQLRKRTSSVSQGGTTPLPRVAESSQNSDLVAPETHSPAEGSESHDDPPSPLRSDINSSPHIRDDQGLARKMSTDLSVTPLRKPSLTKLPENTRRTLPTPPSQLSWPTTESNYQQKSVPGSSAAYDKGEQLEDDSEFGVGNGAYGQYQSRTVDAVRSTATERRDSAASSGSIVAAMRNRFSYNVGSFSPPKLFYL